MTVEEFYKYAVKNDLEQKEIIILHMCSNCGQYKESKLEVYKIWSNRDNEINISM